MKHFFDRGFVRRCRSEGRDDLGTALASHFVRDAGF
jgi:hypothetical protein